MEQQTLRGRDIFKWIKRRRDPLDQGADDSLAIVKVTSCVRRPALFWATQVYAPESPASVGLKTRSRPSWYTLPSVGTRCPPLSHHTSGSGRPRGGRQATLCRVSAVKTLDILGTMLSISAESRENSFSMKQQLERWN